MQFTMANFSSSDKPEFTLFDWSLYISFSKITNMVFNDINEWTWDVSIILEIDSMRWKIISFLFLQINEIIWMNWISMESIEWKRIYLSFTLDISFRMVTKIAFSLPELMTFSVRPLFNSSDSLFAFSTVGFLHTSSINCNGNPNTSILRRNLYHARTVG